MEHRPVYLLASDKEDLLVRMGMFIFTEGILVMKDNCALLLERLITRKDDIDSLGKEFLVLKCLERLTSESHRMSGSIFSEYALLILGKRDQELTFITDTPVLINSSYNYHPVYLTFR